MPDFGLGYRAQRGSVLRPALFEAEYKIVPYHDINGVGLLYFAAYPTISDICELAYTGGITSGPVTPALSAATFSISPTAMLRNGWSIACTATNSSPAAW